jgi:hypothetical protein
LNKAARCGLSLVAFRDFLQQRGKLKERLMWRDYVGLIPSSAAIVNGFIAVLIAQFFKDRPIARAVLVGFAFVLGGAAIGATFYGQSQVIAARDADTKHRHDIREAFGEFISHGKEIEKRIADTTNQSPINDKNIWDNEVAIYLNSNLDESYSIRFHDQTGISPAYLQGVDNDRQKLWWDLHVGLSRLEQFSDQFPY